MKLLKFFMFFLMLPRLSLGADLQCYEALSDFTQKQKQVLINTQEGDYFIRVLVRKAPKKQYVVFLGESHLKNKRDYILGVNVLNEFKVRGLEGINPESYWLSSLLRKKLTYERTQGREFGSTIDRARLSPEFIKKQEEDFAFVLAEATVKFNKTREEIMSFIDGFESGELLPEIDDEKGKYITEAFNYDRVRALFEKAMDALSDSEKTKKEILASISEVETSQEKKREKVFHLEDGHEPDFEENLNQSISSLGHWVYTHSNLFQKIGVGVLFNSVILSTGAEFIGLNGWLDFAKSYWFSVPAILSGVIFLNLGKTGQDAISASHSKHSVTSRDKTMVKNILKALESKEEDIDVLLVVVGAAHVSNQVEMLEKQGFEASDQILWE